ncbi:MAG: zinc ABC transporter substrate-binding protein [Clostridia bacterium]|nr:zinc ABC transporter substrate-binding protein [Clostridia bacterium]
MKKIVILLIASLLLLAGCEKSDSRDKLTVVATLFPQYDFAKNIAGENADVTLLLDFGTDSHSYDPTPRDIMQIASADLFIYTGDSMELWASTILKSADIADAVESGKLKVLDLSKNVTPVCIHGDEHGHSHNDYDPHIWTSPKNASAMCDAIFEAIKQLDGDNAEIYEKNLASYKEKLAAIDQELTRTVGEANKREVFFGGAFAFAYMFYDYGLSHESVYEGCASHAEPSANDVVNVAKKAALSGAKFIVYDSETEKKTAETIANEIGAEIIRMHAVHNISKNEFSSGEDYVSLMMGNVKTLGKALN